MCHKCWFFFYIITRFCKYWLHQVLLSCVSWQMLKMGPGLILPKDCICTQDSLALFFQLMYAIRLWCSHQHQYHNNDTMIPAMMVTSCYCLHHYQTICYQLTVPFLSTDNGNYSMMLTMSCQQWQQHHAILIQIR